MEGVKTLFSRWKRSDPAKRSGTLDGLVSLTGTDWSLAPETQQTSVVAETMADDRPPMTKPTEIEIDSKDNERTLSPTGSSDNKPLPPRKSSLDVDDLVLGPRGFRDDEETLLASNSGAKGYSQSALPPIPSGQPEDFYHSIDFGTQGRDRKAVLKRFLAILGASVVTLALVVVVVIMLVPGRNCPPAVPGNSGSGLFVSEVAGAPRNVIIMIPDGYGPASATLAREFYQVMTPNVSVSHQLPLDTIAIGSCRTRSTSSLVTDSAAGATAYACGIKSYNGAIGVDPDHKPRGTILEAAKLAGMPTGLIVTSRITHATPASFSAHVVHRDMENEIAEFQLGVYPGYKLGHVVDVLFGGGRCHFQPRSTAGSCRLDDKDLLKGASDADFTLAMSREEFDAIKAGDASALPILGLFTQDHMSFELDRDPAVEPSLKEMSEKALSILAAKASAEGKGFFAMIEGSRIDMAGHINDVGGHLRDILAFQDAVEYVKSFVDRTPNTLLVVVADHETGGMALARQNSPQFPEYLWKPEVLAAVTNSSEKVGMFLASYLVNSKAAAADKEKFVLETVVKNWLGISDATDTEIRSLLDTSRGALGLGYAAADMVAYRSQVGWSTHGHSGVDVVLHAHGLHAEKFRGNHENSKIGKLLAEFLNLDVDAVTDKLDGVTKGQMTLRKSKRDLVANYQPIHYHEDMMAMEGSRRLDL